jgi:hypothetical protein
VKKGNPAKAIFRGRACQPAHGVAILHAAVALPLGGAGHAAAAIPKRRDVAAGGGGAGDLAAFVSVGLLLRDGRSRQQCQRVIVLITFLSYGRAAGWPPLRPLQLLAQRCIHVGLTPLSDRLLHLGAGDAARVGFDLVHHIAGRRRRAARRE